MSGTFEVIRDPDTGEAFATVCVSEPLTDEERAVLVELFRLRRARDSEPKERA